MSEKARDELPLAELKNFQEIDELFGNEELTNFQDLNEPPLIELKNFQEIDELLGNKELKNSQDINELVLENKELKNSLDHANKAINLLNADLTDLKKFNHKISQDLDYEKIQKNNFKYINLQLEHAFKTLQANKMYINKLICKKNSASLRINKLITTVKHLQNLVKQKNTIIAKFSYHNSKLMEQAARIIKESYSV